MLLHSLSPALHAIDSHLMCDALFSVAVPFVSGLVRFRPYASLPGIQPVELWATQSLWLTSVVAITKKVIEHQSAKFRMAGAECGIAGSSHSQLLPQLCLFLVFPPGTLPLRLVRLCNAALQESSFYSADSHILAMKPKRPAAKSFQRNFRYG